MVWIKWLEKIEEIEKAYVVCVHTMYRSIIMYYASKEDRGYAKNEGGYGLLYDDSTLFTLQVNLFPTHNHNNIYIYVFLYI